MPVPRTVEDLKTFLDTHEDFGKLGGEDVVSIREDSVELSGIFVTQDVYYKCSVRGLAMSYSRSQVANSALTLFLTDESIYGREIVPKPVDPGWYTTEFPVLVQGNTYELACARSEEIGFSQSDLMTYALELFANNPGINAIYNSYLQRLADKHRVTSGQVEQKILGWMKYQARLKRYDLSLKAGHFVDRAKLL